MVKWPLEKRSEVSRVVVKLKRRSVQWWTLSTRSSLKALMKDPGMRTRRYFKKAARPCRQCGLAKLATVRAFTAWGEGNRAGIMPRCGAKANEPFVPIDITPGT